MGGMKEGGRGCGGCTGWQAAQKARNSSTPRPATDAGCPDFCYGRHARCASSASARMPPNPPKPAGAGSACKSGAVKAVPRNPGQNCRSEKRSAFRLLERFMPAGVACAEICRKAPAAFPTFRNLSCRVRCLCTWGLVGIAAGAAAAGRAGAICTSGPGLHFSHHFSLTERHDCNHRR